MENELGNLLAGLRERAGLTQDDVAAEKVLSQSYLSMVENGKRTPSRDAVIRLMTFYGASDVEKAHALRLLPQDVEVVYGPQVTSFDRSGKEIVSLRAMPEWLGTRTAEECFILIADNEDLSHRKIFTGYAVLFEKLGDNAPAPGDVVAMRCEHGWCMFEWKSGMTSHPEGRQIHSAWEP